MSARIKVLVVDDRPEFLAAARAWLEKEPSTVVVGTARNGSEAITAVRELAPDLVLMDVFMPNMDGFEATAAIKADPRAPIVVLLSLHDDQAMETEAWSAGADGFLSKAEFSARLPAILRNLFDGRVAVPGED